MRTRIIIIILVSYVAMKEPIIDKLSIFAGDTFTVTCDVNRFDSVPATVNSFTLMSIGRKALSDDRFQYLANYTPYARNTSFSESLPKGRNMVLNHTGERLAPDQLNRYSIRVTLTVRQALCSDAGRYQCLATGVEGTRSPVFSSEATLRCKEPVVNKRSFVPGEVFTVTCDPGRFDNIPPMKSSMFMMSMKRKTKLDPTFKVLASYASLDDETKPPKVLSTNDTPTGRKWGFSFTGGLAVKGPYDRATLKITLTVPDSCCSDAGQYMCVAEQNLEKYVLDPYSVTCNEPVVQGTLLRTPSTRPGDRAVYTCTFSGLPSLRVVWKVSIAGIMPEIEYPFANQTHTTGPIMGYNCLGCEVAIFISRLEFTVSPSDNASTYSCFVYDHVGERIRTNMTLCIDGAQGSYARKFLYTISICLAIVKSFIL